MTQPAGPRSVGPDPAVPKPATSEPTGKRALSLKLTVAARQMHKRFDQAVADIGITRSQWTLIAVVSRRPGVTQREAAAILEMSEAAAGRLIDRLAGDGLIVRRPKPDDRRAFCLSLTDAAGAILERISAVASDHEDAVFRGFDASELATLDRYLDRIGANLTQVPARRG